MFLTAPQYSGYFPSYFGKVHAGLAGAKTLTLVRLCSQRLSYPCSPRQMIFPQEGMPGSSGALGSVLSGKEITGGTSPGLWYPVFRRYEFWCMQTEETSSRSVLLLVEKFMDFTLKNQSMPKLVTKMSTDWAEIRVLALKASLETWGLPPEASWEESWEQPQASSRVTFKI